jgi:hypothetical protein
MQLFLSILTISHNFHPLLSFIFRFSCITSLYKIEFVFVQANRARKRFTFTTNLIPAALLIIYVYNKIRDTDGIKLRIHPVSTPEQEVETKILQQKKPEIEFCNKNKVMQEADGWQTPDLLPYEETHTVALTAYTLLPFHNHITKLTLIKYKYIISIHINVI